MKLILFLTTVIVAWHARALAQQPQAPAGIPERVSGSRGPISSFARFPQNFFAPEIAAQSFELAATRPIENERADRPGSFQPAGYVEPAPAALLDSPVWQPAVAGGWVYAVELFSVNAEALRAQLHGRWPLGLELRVYDPVGGFAFGPYTYPWLDEHEDWWTTIIFGDRIGLEFRLASEHEPRTSLPSIKAIAHIAEVPADALAGGCTHHDVTCEPAWANPAEAVTMLSVIDAQGLVVGFCSGALLNREPGDFAPLVMTANHCLGDQPSAHSTSYVWLFQTDTCDGPPPNLNGLGRSDGSLLLKRYIISDWNLVGLYEPPGVGFYLGWNADNFGFAEDTASIHHPVGDFKRINFGQVTGSLTRTFCDDNGNNCFTADVWDIYQYIGHSQPGSSGSPIMDDHQEVRGTLTGGNTENCHLDYYGRLDLAYFFLRYYLGNAWVANPVHVDGSVAGDPGNHGNSEQGDAAHPFNTVHEASFAVRAGDTVQIMPGNYNERFTLWRPMTLMRWGSSGVTRIGN